MTTITSEQFKNDLLTVMTETFESVYGIYLDKSTSLFETLAQISAAEASIPVGGKCATLAAQVAHVRFYLDVTEQYVKTGDNQSVDWGEIWRTVREVTPEEWAALQENLKQSYQNMRKTLESYDQWDVEYSIAGAIGVVTHTAYHLGEIRQATCTLRP
jgi:pantothenate kinase